MVRFPRIPVASLCILLLVAIITSCTGVPAAQTPPAPVATPPITQTPTTAATPTPAPTFTPKPTPPPTTKPAPTITAPSPTKPELHQVKVASVFKQVTHIATNSVINILKETKTDFVFRAFDKFGPTPVKCSQFQQPGEAQRNERLGNSYEILGNVLRDIKKELPNVIFCGGICPQIIGEEPERCEWNPKTGERIEQAELWKMALDPGKWGINVSKERFQYDFAKWHYWIPQDLAPNLYDWRTADAYFPDITNPRYQELLLSWAQAQIDAGADVIGIDLLFMQWARLRLITRNDNHPAVKESREAACKIVDEIHKYGSLKGKHIYVGSWPESMFVGSLPASFDYPPPDFDFIQVTPETIEVKEMKLDEAKWDKSLADIRKRYGNIPLFAFIDWSVTSDTPLGVFSQRLSREERVNFLKVVDAFFTSKGVIFMYPIWGGHLGNDATVLSSGKYLVWDSKAPEFQLYDAIKELAQSKKPR